MNIRQQLNLKLSQNLVMTQSLQQAIKLLQLSKMELEQLIQEELSTNPVLEEVSNETEVTTEERTNAALEDVTNSVDSDPEALLKEIDQDYFFADYIEYQHQRAMREELELPAFDATLTKPTNLTDHLAWQLQFSAQDEQTREIGEAIIGNLNSDGYLRASVVEIAELVSAGEAEVEEVLRMVQQFDPVGVASRSLQECLLIQLDYLEPESDLPHRIVTEYLGHLQRHAYDELGKELGCSLEEIQGALEIIRSLDPKPGSKYNATENTFVEPDVFIVRDGDDYRIILNEEDLPKLRINRSYQRLLAKDSGEKEDTRNFVRERLNSAKWLLKSFVQRQRTIYKVVESIVKKQKEFLDHGIEHLRPMILSDVAYDIGMHESTVSRVVTNKFVHTPRGVYELKFFFSSGIRSETGEDVSSLAVKRRIRQIVENEDPRKPLSDSKIMATLNKEGLKIARRTVAKYREEMRIPPSKLRKSVF
ncbi:MAG TPA: RNA polymerase factor sigma-54 [Acidobacteriota bacterium]|nr:RNA polymerase factor sigma-54 [Acidobacteriota bacterium]